MIIAIDFDNTVVEQDGNYADLETPLRLKPGAMAALTSLKAAGHILLLFSARANRALVGETPDIDPLHRAGVVNRAQRPASLCLNTARFNQMVCFVEEKLPGIFDAIDDGLQGKPNADLFIDDKAITFGPLGMNWQGIAARYGETA
jgi:hypothetical protein